MFKLNSFFPPLSKKSKTFHSSCDTIILFNFPHITIKCISFFKKKKKYHFNSPIRLSLNDEISPIPCERSHDRNISSVKTHNDRRKILTDCNFLQLVSINRYIVGLDRETRSWTCEKMDVVENFTDSSFYLRPLIIQAHSRDKFYHRRREGPACIKKLASYKGGRLSDEFIHDSSNFLIPGNRASW